MNREETHAAIEVMQAWFENKPIQIRDNGSNKWRPIGTEYQGASQPSWDWSSATYRIKPKPREFWLDLTDNTFIEADKGSKYWGEEHELIKVREVLS